MCCGTSSPCSVKDPQSAPPLLGQTHGFGWPCQNHPKTHQIKIEDVKDLSTSNGLHSPCPPPYLGRPSQERFAGEDVCSSHCSILYPYCWSLANSLSSPSRTPPPAARSFLLLVACLGPVGQEPCPNRGSRGRGDGAVSST